jgi:hypothetical protein
MPIFGKKVNYTQLTATYFVNVDAVEAMDIRNVVGRGTTIFLHMNSGVVHEVLEEDLTETGQYLFDSFLEDYRKRERL